MTRTFETKNRIINLLKDGEKTPMEISRLLNVVPSTVSQHLKELKMMGAVEEIGNPHFHNTKSFKLSPNYIQTITAQNVSMPRRLDLRIALGAVVVLAALGALLYGIYNTPSGSVLSPGTSTLPILLTDPPQVPNGTSALTLYYSSIALHSADHANSTGFTQLNTSGSVNLMTLVNQSQVLALANVNSSARFDMVVIDVTKATITIENKTYNVTVPSGRIFIKLNENLNASSSGGALIDFTPAIIQIYGNNNSTFVLVPSAVAVALRKGEIGSHLHLGETQGLSSKEEDSISHARAQMAITGESIAVSGNTESISVTVKNDGNTTVDIKHVMVQGYMRAIMNFTHNQQDQMPIMDSINGGMGVDSHSDSGFSSNIFGGMNTSGDANASLQSNLTVGMGSSHGEGDGNGTMTASENESLTAAIKSDTHMMNMSSTRFKELINQTVVFERQFHHTLNFMVQSNSTVLSLPFSENEAEGPNGYALAPNQSVTFTFNGMISVGGEGMHIVDLLANQTYSIRVTGTEGASASANTTAT